MVGPIIPLIIKEATTAGGKKLLKKYGETATLNFSIDNSLIVGITVKVDDEVLDLSIRGKVQKLVNELNF